MKTGTRIKILQNFLKSGKTKPPARFTDATLLAACLNLWRQRDVHWQCSAETFPFLYDGEKGNKEYQGKTALQKTADWEESQIAKAGYVGVFFTKSIPVKFR